MWTPVNYILIYGTLFSSLRMLVGAISAAYLVSVGVDIQEISLIKGFQAFIIFFFDIPLGYLADKKSRKMSILLSVFFAILWLLAMGMGTKIYHFYIAEFFNAISIALLSGAFVSYLIDNRSKDIHSEFTIQEILGKYSKYQFIGMGIAAFIGSAFISVDSRSIWITAAVLITFQFLFLSWTLPSDNMKRKVKKTISMRNDIYNITKDIFRNLDIKWYIFSLLLLAIYYQIIIQFWQLIIYQENNNLQENGLYFGVIFSLILFMQSLSGYFAEKFSLRTNNIAIIIVTIIASIIVFLPFEEDIYFMYLLPLSIILIFFSNRLMMIVISSQIHEQLDSNKRATYDSVISTITRLFLIIIIPLFGLVIHFMNNKAYLLIFICSFIGYLFIMYIMSPKKQNNFSKDLL